MALNANPSDLSQARTAGLFCLAPLLELMSAAQRFGENGGTISAPATAKGRPEARPLIRRRRRDRSAPIFHMAIDPSGWWEIREQNGSRAGLFRTRQAAIKYARDESPDGQFVIIDDVA